ncbi:sterol desaturase family protein [Sediminibacterium ginsengisoli]|uniref:Sterol desaturase/sphingolipid hydroxylase, fatty acid hydroxylase superfamily n=1 Tax=Sediminibacterium ginsengisoli TaxID=413434 RepID=A0A1T4QPR4_9BACT|nr:sterol desaturase family protein [Sediminibacterium ginsengisoli]SKA05749.1 Sterol desaturase/sphingolipid hydroxylase, fatty acid hydroxylase superfamily [Sediminibacterium ginsengisoli]
METYGKILLIAMPVFLGLVLLEKWYGWYRGKETVRSMDMLSSLSSGITNVTKDVLGLSIAIISYHWMLAHLALVQTPPVFLTYLIAFLALDLSGYWVHRISHEYNIFWNNHLIHHSSEDFNLACALRQSISVFVRLFTVFLLPAALLGVPEQVIAVVAPLHLFAQFWYHTEHIRRMGWLEKIIVTPSHHRVHHAINKEYLDKNYGQILIIWDKLFGTYQEELETVPAVYGITRPVQTWNPIRINFMHVGLLFRDAWYTRHLKDKFRIWLMPTGWRPADVAERFPVHKIEDVYRFDKYEPSTNRLLMGWTWIQFMLLLLFVSYLFANITSIGSPGIFVYGGFIFLCVYAFTELMDLHPFAWIWELLKDVYACSVLYLTGDWFGISAHAKGLVPSLAAYFILSALITVFVSLQTKKRITALQL